MASPMVVISLEHLEYLKRRAQANIVGPTAETRESVSLICIGTDEYYELCRHSLEAVAIKKSLREVGMTERSLELQARRVREHTALPDINQTSHEPKPQSKTASHSSEMPVISRSTQTSPNLHSQAEIRPPKAVRSKLNPASAVFHSSQSTTPTTPLSASGEFGQMSQQARTGLGWDRTGSRMGHPIPAWAGNVDRFSRARLIPSCLRTATIVGIADDVDYSDVTSAVHGGPLLDVEIVRAFPPADYKVARVSFIFEEDAMRFYNDAGKFGIRIKGKMVPVVWTSNQLVLSEPTVTRLMAGAARNIVIKNKYAPESTIRANLEHISNIVIIKVENLASGCHIKTNSVDCGYAAKQYMDKHKHGHAVVEWDVDECDNLANPTTMVGGQNTLSTPERKAEI